MKLPCLKHLMTSLVSRPVIQFLRFLHVPPTLSTAQALQEFQLLRWAHLHGPAPHRGGDLGAFVKVEHHTQMEWIPEEMDLV